MIILTRILAHILALLSLAALQRWGRALGWVLGRVIRHRRAQVLETLARCFPEKTDAQRAAIADGMYRHLATVVLECLRYSEDRAIAFRSLVDVRGREHVDALRAQGHGALVLMGHLGNWELMGPVASGLWGQIDVVVRPQHNAAFDTYWRTSREKMGVRSLPAVHAYRDCLRALARNEVVAIIVDQNMRRQRGIFVDFFGQPACTTPGLAYLAAHARLPVVPICMIREPGGRHTLHVLPPLPPPPDRRPETIHAATQAYTAAFEELVRSYPEQWIWLHKRWRTRP